VLLSLFDLNDNHVIDLTTTDRSRLERAVDVFETWYESRADRGYYESRGKPYPVFIVAASGGGLYAAHHASTVLSRLQDLCPNFSQHLFAISGVSGGSLGGALFASLAKRNATNAEHVPCSLDAPAEGGGPFERHINRFLETDFLSPLLAATFFPDAVQRFLPKFTSLSTVLGLLKARLPMPGPGYIPRRRTIPGPSRSFSIGTRQVRRLL